MGLKDDPHRAELRAAGWYTRGYLPHFDGRPLPQYIGLHLEDSVPKKVIERWERELSTSSEKERIVLLQRRIDRYADQGYGNCWLKDPTIAKMIQDSLMDGEGVDYKLFAWVVMPNHTHSLLTRFEHTTLAEIMQAHKSYTAHEANEMLGLSGQFWMKEYFDRFIRNADHFRSTVKYIEDNPVKAGLCREASDWPFSSAWFKKHGLR